MIPYTFFMDSMRTEGERSMYVYAAWLQENCSHTNSYGLSWPMSWPIKEPYTIHGHLNEPLERPVGSYANCDRNNNEK